MTLDMKLTIVCLGALVIGLIGLVIARKYRMGHPRDVDRTETKEAIEERAAAYRNELRRQQESELLDEEYAEDQKEFSEYDEQSHNGNS